VRKTPDHRAYFRDSWEGLPLKKILVIDDEAPTLEMLRLFLGACGYQVFIANNEEEGLDIFRREAPPIVLTDIKMPGKDGFSILKSIKEMQPETEVIVITGHGDRDLEKRAFELNASDFFKKPLDTEALESALRKLEGNLNS
jgi:YesN/AraC family two-component response regulator